METICTEVKNVDETTEHDAHCFDISVFPESSCLETVITGREMLSSPPPHPLTHTALTAHSPGGGDRLLFARVARWQGVLDQLSPAPE